MKQPQLPMYFRPFIGVVSNSIYNDRRDRVSSCHLFRGERDVIEEGKEVFPQNVSKEMEA